MTYSEVQQQLNKTKFQKAILGHIIEHLDGNFLTKLGENPKNALLTEDKQKVPEESFNEVAETLNTWVKTLIAQESYYLSATFTPPEPVPPPTPTEEVKS